MTQAAEPIITRIAPWFGANALLSEEVGKQIGRRAWVGVPFCGSCSELLHIDTRSGVAADLHRHLINLCRVIRDGYLCGRLADRLSMTLFHEDELRQAQARCLARQHEGGLFGEDGGGRQDTEPDPDWAFDYFVCCWMGPGAFPGKETEFTSFFCSRWTASGGASSKRFRSATESLQEWCKALARWEFRRIDAFDFITQSKDRKDHALYCDPPWPDQGAEYAYRFTVEQHRRLEAMLREFKHARVVVRYGDHPLIRELYCCQHNWRWIEQTSRDQTNKALAEVMIVNSPSNTEGSAA